MKRSILLSLAGLTLVAACTDTLTSPADVADAASGRLAPRGPLLDDIVNNIDATVDVVAEEMPLNVGGSNGTTALYLVERNGDGKNGCNLTGGTTLSLSISSSNTSIATVSPARFIWRLWLRAATCNATRCSCG